MAEWSFSCGSQVTGYLYVAENWNNSTQVSYHIRLRYYKSGGAYNNVGDANWNGNVGGVTGSGNWTYSSATGWTTLWEFDYTYGKDANGNLTINCYGYINGANGSLFGAGSTSQNISPARIGIAPTISTASVTNRTSTTATLNMTVTSIGLGTSVTTDRMYYKRTIDASWTSTSDLSGTGSKAFNISSLEPNRAYHYLARAINNNGDTRNLPASYPSASYVFYTLPRAATIGTIIPDATTATVPYTQATDGAAYAITTNYRIKTAGGAYGAWTPATGGTISLTGLTPATDYVIQTQSSSTAGNTDGAEYNFTTLPAAKLVYSDGTVVNAIPRVVKSGEATVMANVNIVGPA